MREEVAIRVVVHVLAAALICGSTLWAGCVGFLWANERRIVYRTHVSRASAMSAMPAPEYRGFGRNEGTPTEAGLYEDAHTAYRYLTEQLRVPPSRVVVAGRSLGSAVAVELAARAPVAGVVLLSPIDSIVSMGARMYPWVPVRFLASSRFDAIGKIARVRAPMVVIHAVNDRWVPLAAARVLFANAPGPKVMLETAGGHNGAGFEDIALLRDALARFWPVAAPAVAAD